jgi:hypothetical protein
MPIPFEASQPVRAGDLIVLATDGIRGDFAPLPEHLRPAAAHRRADRRAARHRAGRRAGAGGAGERCGMSEGRSGLEKDYREALHEHLTEPSETTLERAYEMGRAALAARLGVLELAQVHLQAARAEESAAEGTATWAASGRCAPSSSCSRA